MKRQFGLAALALFLTLPLAAETTLCNPEQKNCTVKEAFDFYRALAIETKVEKDVTNTNRPTTAPSSFAGRVHNSYEDFLNQLSFAINKVDESKDGKALIIRFNPRHAGANLFGATLTFAEPVVGDTVKNAIGADQREAAVTSLQKKLTDTSDLTWSASYSRATLQCEPSRAANKPCWGRSTETYRHLLSILILPSLGSAKVLGDVTENLMNEMKSPPDLMKASLSEAGDKQRALQLIRNAVGEEMKSKAEAKSLYKSHHLDILPKLIDNQPQATINASYRKPDALTGPAERAASFEFHYGDQNINTIRAACADKADKLAECLQEQIDAIAASDALPTKYVVTATYKKSAGYNIASLAIEPPVIFQPIALHSASEWNVKGQAGRPLATEVSGKQLRTDGSIEFVRAEKGGIRSTNRFVAVATLSIPFGDNITVPVSLTYANKPEFIGDVTKQIGAHFGLSYRLPDLFGSK